MNIFIGSLPFTTKEGDLRQLFENYGEVSRASVISDKFTGRSRGFGFVEMPDDDSAKQAIEGLDGSDLNGRAIVVKEAMERTQNDRPRRDNNYR